MIVEDDNFEVVDDKEDGEFVVEVVVGLNDNSKKNSKKKTKKKKSSIDLRGRNTCYSNGSSWHYISSSNWNCSRSCCCCGCWTD